MDINSHQNYDNAANQLPPGFRFHPTDEELITYYLLKKVLDSKFTGRAIAEADLNKCKPWELPESVNGRKRVVLFQPETPEIPYRATYEPGDGGRILESYRAPKGEKSNWVMHEYRLEGKFAYHFLSRSNKDEWVISRVLQKNGAGAVFGLISRYKKTRGSEVSIFPEPSLLSLVRLPPLLDS